ncbi:hypothetical protein, partial [Anabaena sp. FACHB-1250]|uniref:hypothetical protein n=1 Tax=Anabaena sp. FACHB-1250 TaxID=2692770 RepID=UPI001A7F0955
SSIWAATIFSRRSTEYAFMTVLSLLLLTVPHNFGNCCNDKTLVVRASCPHKVYLIKMKSAV